MKAAIEATKQFIQAQTEPFSIDDAKAYAEYETETEFSRPYYCAVIWQAARDRLREEGITLRNRRGKGLYEIAGAPTAAQQAKQFLHKGTNAYTRAKVSLTNALQTNDAHERNTLERSLRSTQTILGAIAAQGDRKAKPEPALGSTTQGDRR